MRVNDKGLKDLAALARTLAREKARVAVGVIGSAGGGEAAGEGAGITLAALAAVHEFGATINHPGGTPYAVLGPGRARFVKRNSPAGIKAIAAGRVTRPHTITLPERAPIRKTLDTKRAAIRQVTRSLLERVVRQELELDKALALLGLYVSSQVQRTIQAGLRPGLKPGTIRRKGSDKPLIDTLRLVRSYTYEVRRGKR